MGGRVELLSVEPLSESKYLKPKRINYKEFGVEKNWDIVEVHSSVAILLYHKDRDALLLVKQLRPAIYMQNQDGITYELCAGISDKEGLNSHELAVEEIEEEAGFKVSTDSLLRVTEFYTSVGFAGSKQELFYAEIDDSMKIGEGGGVMGEVIELYYLPVHMIEKFIFDESCVKTPGLLFALMWFICHKK